MSVERNLETMHRYFDLLFGKNMDDLLNLFADEGRCGFLHCESRGNRADLRIAVLLRVPFQWSGAD
jgi:hypothetical protein